MEKSAGIGKARSNRVRRDYLRRSGSRRNDGRIRSTDLAGQGGGRAVSAWQATAGANDETRNRTSEHLADGLHRLSARHPAARVEMRIGARLAATSRFQHQCDHSFAGYETTQYRTAGFLRR